MSHRLLIHGSMLSTLMLVPALAAGAEDTPQLAAVRSMHATLIKKDFALFYRDWCHPHLQGQLDSEAFIDSMKSDQGKAVIQLFADVIKAMDGRAGKDVIVAQPQDEDDQYEFILVSLKSKARSQRKGAQWHLELQLHAGKWKLMDTD